MQSGGIMVRLSLLTITAGVLTTVAGCGATDRVGDVERSRGAAVQEGRAAYIDPDQGKIVEINLDGRETWEFSIPPTVIDSGDLGMGADIEWIPLTDHFLFVVPLRGVFEVDRAKQIVWSHKTQKISHDADRLPNGNTIFVDGWDRDDDATVTEIDVAGNVVFQWFARDHLDARERQDVLGEPAYSFTHANAVQRLEDGRTLISLRNFLRFVIVRNGEIVKEVRRVSRVHDPVAVGNVFFFAMHGRRGHGVVRINSDGTRTLVFGDETGKWQLLRTLEILKNGNILITGGQLIGQITSEGTLVWSIGLDGFAASKEASWGGQGRGAGRQGRRAASLLYKAAWVYK